MLQVKDGSSITWTSSPSFLNDELQEEVFIQPPPGFEIEGQRHKVLQLVKALYGLRQAPRT
jgi:hypothetical protein